MTGQHILTKMRQVYDRAIILLKSSCHTNQLRGRLDIVSVFFYIKNNV